MTYDVEQLTERVAVLMGCGMLFGEATLKARFVAHRLPSAGPLAEDQKTKPCVECGKLFRKGVNVSIRRWLKVRFCSKACVINHRKGVRMIRMIAQQRRNHLNNRSLWHPSR